LGARKENDRVRQEIRSKGAREKESKRDDKEVARKLQDRQEAAAGSRQAGRQTGGSRHGGSKCLQVSVPLQGESAREEGREGGREGGRARERERERRERGEREGGRGRVSRGQEREPRIYRFAASGR